MIISMFLLLKNLRALFKHDDFVCFFSSNNSLDDKTLITDFVNANRCKSSAFLRNKYIVKIQLCYDDMATTNPLQEATPYSNLSVFYYTIRNLPDFFNTCLRKNVFLLFSSLSKSIVQVQGKSQVVLWQVASR